MEIWFITLGMPDAKFGLLLGVSHMRNAKFAQKRKFHFW
jgi:hypothetical protein